MKQKLKKLLREINQKSKERAYKRDENGKIIIPFVVQDDSDFLSVFAESETPLIGTDVAEYLEEKTDELPLGEPILLRVRSSCIDPAEQEAYRTGIREYYMIRYLSCRKELRRNTFIAALLAATGMLALFVMHLIDLWTGSSFWSEVVDIIAWVFVWESVDVFAFRNHELRKERLRCLSLMAMELEFIPLHTTV